MHSSTAFKRMERLTSSKYHFSGVITCLRSLARCATYWTGCDQEINDTSRCCYLWENIDERVYSWHYTDMVSKLSLMNKWALCSALIVFTVCDVRSSRIVFVLHHGCTVSKPSRPSESSGRYFLVAGCIGFIGSKSEIKTMKGRLLIMKLNYLNELEEDIWHLGHCRTISLDKRTRPFSSFIRSSSIAGTIWN